MAPVSELECSSLRGVAREGGEARAVDRRLGGEARPWGGARQGAVIGVRGAGRASEQARIFSIGAACARKRGEGKRAAHISPGEAAVAQACVFRLRADGGRAASAREQQHHHQRGRRGARPSPRRAARAPRAP